MLVQHAAGDHKQLDGFVQWADMASAPALLKACAAQSSFVNMQGEWGHVLKGMSSPRSHEGPMGALRRTITSLYSNKSKVGLNYSDSDKNVLSEGSVAFSMLAETTPGTFYSALTADMLSDGFMSRFNLIEYTGDRPDDNPKPIHAPTPALVDMLRGLMVQAETIRQSMTTRSASPVLVEPDDKARAALDEFRIHCAQAVRKCGDNEAQRQLWNRAHLKALKVASLLAVADSPYQPEITLGHAEWALALVWRDIQVFLARIANGDIGDDDNVRQNKLVEMCREYAASKSAPRGYGIPDAMHLVGVVPRKYLQVRSARLKLFTDARDGPVRALDTALRSMCDSGYLLEVDKMKAADDYGFQGRCFRIVSFPGEMRT